MNIPAFTADRALGSTSAGNRVIVASRRELATRDRVIPAQNGEDTQTWPGWWPPYEETPLDRVMKEPLDLPPDWKPPSWMLEPAVEPPWWGGPWGWALVIDAGAAAAGGFIGYTIDRALAGSGPGSVSVTPPATSTCVTNPVPPRVRSMNYTWWGSAWTQARAQAEANKICATVPGQCSGSCPAPAGCQAIADIIPGTYISGPSWGGFATTTSFSYTCECRC
jgi:hypothetical protein